MARNQDTERPTGTATAAIGAQPPLPPRLNREGEAGEPPLRRQPPFRARRAGGPHAAECGHPCGGAAAP